MVVVFHNQGTNYSTLNTPVISKHLKLKPNDSRRLAKLCGQFDEHLHQIESRLDIEIKNRGNDFELSGVSEKALLAAEDVIDHLYAASNRNEIRRIRLHVECESVGKASREFAAA